MTKPTLYIICGLPFSGKTYLSKKISEQAKISRLSYDELWQEIKNTTGEDLGWLELSKLAHQKITDSLKKNQSIIYDTLNDTVYNREVLSSLARSVTAQTVIVFVNTPDTIIQQRQQANNKTNERHTVSTARFIESLNRFEPPTSAEHALEFTPDKNLEKWINANIINRTN